MPTQIAAGEWMVLELPVPLAVHPPNTYMVVVWHPPGNYVAVGHYFDSGAFASGQDVVKGPLIIPSSINSSHQGAFRYDWRSDIYPTNTYNSTAYYSDIILTTQEPGN